MWLRVTILALWTASYAPCSPPETPGVHYSNKQLRSLVRNARTAEDHERLASYFHERAVEFAAREAEQERSLAEYLDNPGRYPTKYPTRGDIATDLAAYYRMKAREANALASEQERGADQIRKPDPHPH
jgi:hypothetical protein